MKYLILKASFKNHRNVDEWKNDCVILNRIPTFDDLFETIEDAENKIGLIQKNYPDLQMTILPIY